MSIKCCSALKLTTLLSFLLFSSSTILAQVALTLSSGAASPGQTVQLDLSLASTGTRPAALQWTFMFPSSDFTAIAAVPGPSATSASKKLQCNGVSGSYTCVLYGVNPNTIPDGVVATVTLTLSSSTNPRTITVANVVSASSSGSSLVSSATGGTVLVQASSGTPALSRLTCTSSSILGSGTTICTVVLNAAAPRRGAVVALSDNSNLVTTPVSVTVPARAFSAVFTASAARVSTDTNVAITASFNGSTANTSLNLIAPTVPVSLSCIPATLRPGSNGTCTVRLNEAAPSGGLLVTISENSTALTVPASVTVAAGSMTTTFAAYAGNVSATRTVIVTGTANTVSVSAAIIISTTAVPPQISGLTCTPTSISSGASTACTVIISSPAPTGGTLVTLSDNSALLTTPTSVLVPASASTATFQITAGTVTTTQTAVVTATVNGISKTASVSLIASTTCPCSLWKPTTVPTLITQPDTAPVELGVKFRTSVAGYILGVRFYKGPQNTGTHSGSLWSQGGTLLANVTFKKETASGWQQADFSRPIAVAANTTYVISYWSPASHYSNDSGYFQSGGTASGPLYALADGEDGGNGVYNYSRSAFPTSTWASSNYWVDVVFNIVPSTTLTIVPAKTDTLLTRLPTPQLAASPTRSVTADEVVEIPVRSLHCAPKAVQAGGSFTCQLELPTDAGSSILPVAAGSSDVRLPATVQARAQQRLLTFRGTVDKAAPQSTYSISVGEDNDLVEDQITVIPSSGPVLSLPAAQSVKAGEPVSFQISAQDPAGLPVQISASNLPNGASFQQDSGRFEWSPAFHQQGDHTLSFTAVNGSGESAERQTQIHVDSGNPAIAKIAPSLCSPGAVATLAGRWLSPGGETFADPSGSSLELGGTKVRVNGSFMPMLFAGSTQVDFLCPSAEAGTRLEITVETSSGSATTDRTDMAAAHPQLLLAPDLGSKQALVTIADTDRIAVAREYHGLGEPAQLGDVVSFRATGLGIADSYAGSLFVKVDGVDAPVESVLPAPDTAGVFLIQVRIPAAASLGNEIPVSLELVTGDGQHHSSNTATIAIE